DADPDVQKAAAEAMGAIGQAAAGDLPALRAALKEKGSSAALRANAARKLAALGPAAKDAVPELAEALKEPDVTVRRAAAAALAQVGAGGKGALLVLIDALGD